MLLSVVIPAFNEEKRLPPTLTHVLQYFYKYPVEFEIVVVDDGSTDKTPEIVKQFAREEKRIKLLKLKLNYGKGYAVRQGMLLANGDIRLFMDADNSTTIDHFQYMQVLFNNGCDVVIGSRREEDAEGAAQVIKQSFVKRYMGHLGNKFVRFVTGLPFYDTQCGFKAFTKEAANTIFKELRTKRWAFDVEVLMLARKSSFKIGVIPVKWKNDPLTKVRIFDYFRTLIDVVIIAENLKISNKS